jgi:hypothetical protein
MVREGHHAGYLTDGQVPDRAIVQADDALAAGDAMDACLNCLRRSIEIVGGMPWILMRPGPADMVLEVGVLSAENGFRKVPYGVTQRAPRLQLLLQSRKRGCSSA